MAFAVTAWRPRVHGHAHGLAAHRYKVLELVVLDRGVIFRVTDHGGNAQFLALVLESIGHLDEIRIVQRSNRQSELQGSCPAEPAHSPIMQTTANTMMIFFIPFSFSLALISTNFRLT